MSPDQLDDTAALIEVTRRLYTRDEAALELLDRLERRIREPLRLAIAGIVKAGKSTLLNAILGEQIACEQEAGVDHGAPVGMESPVASRIGDELAAFVVIIAAF